MNGDTIESYRKVMRKPTVGAPVQEGHEFALGYVAFEKPAGDPSRNEPWKLELQK